MRFLVFGGTGLLGQTLCMEAQGRGHEVMSVARTGADHTIDIRNEDDVARVLNVTMPDVVVNAAALVNLATCEADPAAAHRVNARPAALLAHWSQETGKPFVQISTDHFFDGDGAAKHGEAAPITLCNEYARSKYAAEGFALGSSHALVLRTSLAGFHPDGRGFAQWAMDALMEHKPLTLFDDFYGSTIDVQSFSVAVLDMVKLNARGVYNLASRDVSSKKTFIHALADVANINLDWAQTGSVTDLQPPRARSLGLDVSKAENLLGRALPTRKDVCKALVSQWRETQ